MRKKKNKSGVISVQVIDKCSGKYKMLKTIGSSSDPEQVASLVAKGEEWIRQRTGQSSLDFSNEREFAEALLDNVEQVSVAGTSILLGGIFEQIGFGIVSDELFKQLVIARLTFPASKLKTADLLSKYHFLSVEPQHIYRYLDKLHRSQKELVQDIGYAHSLKVLNGRISIVF